MLDINLLQEVKLLVKLNTCWNIWLFLSNVQGEIIFQKLQNLRVAKVLMSWYILCKILSFQARVAQEVFNTSGSYSLAELIILWTFNIQNWFICSSIRNWIACANKANIVMFNMEQVHCFGNNILKYIKIHQVEPKKIMIFTES